MLGEVLTAIVTPFDREGRVDLDRFRELATFLVENGSDGIVVCGTTGESPTLSDAVLVVTPYYSKPPQRAIVAHFEAIAAASDKPIVVYNIPGRVVVNIEPQTIERLAKIETVRAVKQANDDLEQARQIPGLGLDLYAGDDYLIFPFLELGGIGGVCVHTHVAGPQVKAMVRAYREGDRARAKQLDDELQPAYDLLKVVTNPIAIKAALNLLGHEVGGLRLPLVEADEAETAAVRACLERLGALVPA